MTDNSLLLDILNEDYGPSEIRTQPWLSTTNLPMTFVTSSKGAPELSPTKTKKKKNDTEGGEFGCSYPPSHTYTHTPTDFPKMIILHETLAFAK